jgi:hypothetical protein
VSFFSGLPGDVPVGALSQSLGPVSTTWSLYPDRLEILSSSWMGGRETSLPLAQIDTVSQVEEVPWVVLLGAGFAGAFFGILLWGGLWGNVAGGWVFLAALVLGFLSGAARWLRLAWLVVETVGGTRYFFLASRPSRGQVGDFLRLLRQCRTLVLTQVGGDWIPETLGDSVEGMGVAEEGPVDPRWIN